VRKSSEPEQTVIHNSRGRVDCDADTDPPRDRKPETRKCREELRQADEAKIQRPFRDFVDLPADGDCLHLGGQDEEERASWKRTKLG